MQVGLIRFELRYSKCIQHPRPPAATRTRVARTARTARATRVTRTTRTRATRTARVARTTRDATCAARRTDLARTREDTYV